MSVNNYYETINAKYYNILVNSIITFRQYLEKLDYQSYRVVRSAMDTESMFHHIYGYII